ncbi:hypothetical protein, partial [Cesiribacter sp. SM1]|uniref:hypothetical protein n=1 Tax=Cesiribacter sp. SM1 TaxID=2861196 RepID=UPI001CD67796
TLLCSHEAFATCCTAEDSSMLLLLLSQYKLDRQRIELMPQRPLNKAGAGHRHLSKDAKYGFCGSMAKSSYSPCFILLLCFVYFYIIPLVSVQDFLFEYG